MKQAPYSYQDAWELCEEFQQLIGKKFDPEGDAFIDCIAITPFDENSKKRFLICYLLFNDPHIALNYDYKGLLYDVIVIASTPGTQDMCHEALNTWLAKNISMASRQLHFSGISTTITTG
jgi:hypothetical protein